MAGSSFVPAKNCLPTATFGGFSTSEWALVLVFSNQATMYQSSETGHATVGEAIAAGDSGKSDYGANAQLAFTHYAKYSPIKKAPLAPARVASPPSSSMSSVIAINPSS